MSDTEFNYDHSLTVSQNFKYWYELNTDEREEWNESKLGEAEAYELFVEIFANDVDK